MPPKRKVPLRPYPGRAKGFPLCEKYAPRTADDLGACVFGGTIKRVREWVQGALNPQPGEAPRRLLVLCGPPGIGKSTTLEVVCSELGVDLRRWRDMYGFQAYDKRRRLEPTDYREAPYESQVALWTQFVRESSRYESLVAQSSPSRTREKGRALVLLDELPDPDRNAEAIGQVLEVYFGDAAATEAAPAVLVWSSGIAEKSEAKFVVERALGESLLARSTVECIECIPVTEKKSAKVLEAVARAEGKVLSDRILERLATEARGDLRRALTSLDVALRGGGNNKKDGRAVTNSSEEAEEEDGGGDDDGPSVAAGVVCDLHAIGRLLRAKRSPATGRLDFKADALMEQISMAVDATVAFLQFNAVDFFSDDAQVADALESFSTAELFAARTTFATVDSSFDRADPTFPRRYAESIAARTVAVANAHPAPSKFRPVRKPRHYEVAAAQRRARSRRESSSSSSSSSSSQVNLDLPSALAARVGRPLAADLDDDDGHRTNLALQEDDIEDFDD